MRVVLVTESFLPEVNGVTNSVLRVLEHLREHGHEAFVVAPAGPAIPLGAQAAAQRTTEPRSHAGFPVLRVRSVGMPGYAAKRVGLPTRRLEDLLAYLEPDVVHLASPFLLGWHAAVVAHRLGIPTVAVYQTDVAGFARHYRLTATAPVVWRWLRRVHELADLTLAPSSAACADLAEHGIPRVALWPRGVDVDRFGPGRRDAALRERLAPGGEVLVGYVGRLAAEKGVDRLAAVPAIPGARLVLVGDGPQGGALRRRMPGAAFLGHLDGADLAGAVAALDVFVHPGERETFCQAVQEALASGVPVVAVDAGGPRDLVRHGVTGLLVPPGDDAALQRAVARLVAEPGLRQAMAAQARPSVAARTWPRVCADLVEHYRRAGAARGRVGAAA